MGLRALPWGPREAPKNAGEYCVINTSLNPNPYTLRVLEQGPGLHELSWIVGL